VVVSVRIHPPKVNGNDVIYRTDIDGMRAIAIVSVIVFHLSENWLPGGFLGVDIFFVISGFLITGIIYDDLKIRTFTYARFYARRLRRIAPALFATLILSAIAASFLLNAEQMSDFGSTLLFSLFGLSNFYFYEHASYFDVAASARPLLHTWSLAVEEQFYVFWPLFLAVLVKIPTNARWALFVFVIISSTLAGEYLAFSNPDAAFYLLPSRVAELGIGGFACIIRREYRSYDKLLRPLAGYVHALALLVLLVCFTGYTKNLPFPGLTALPPSLATAALLLFPVSGKLGLVLANRVMRWIGLISYSAYLLHWPAIVFYKTYKLTPLTAVDKISLFLFAMVGGAVFYKFVESPFRFRNGRKPVVSNRLLTMSGVSAVFLMVWFGSQALSGQNWVRVNKNEFIEQLALNRTRSYESRKQLVSQGACHQFKGGTVSDFSHCLELDSSKKNILVLGSSFAADERLVLMYAYPDASVKQITSQGCASYEDTRPHCKLTSNYIFKNTNRINKFDAVIFSDSWELNMETRNLEMLIGRLTASTIIMGPRGILSDSMLSVVEKMGVGPGSDFIDSKFDHPDNDAVRAEILNFARQKKVGFVDMQNILRSQGGLPIFAENDHLLFYDEGHYTPEGARAVSHILRSRFPDVNDFINILIPDNKD
jgi:peptidoglycan/LPS O-acetylase OafA/YrhL